MARIALLRVGADSGNLGFHGPLFADGSYDYIPINEKYNQLPKNKGKEIVETRTYGSTKSLRDKFLIDYFLGNKSEKFKNKIIHFDPEFETFTYGDPSFTKKKLGELQKDDYLLMYCSLTDQVTGITALYLFSYFCIEYSVNVTDVNSRKSMIDRGFGKNFHVMHEQIFKRDVTTERNRGLKLVKGNLEKSKVLQKPFLISKKTRYPDGVERFDISDEMQNIFGDFDGHICIQRNSLRIVNDTKCVETTIEWLKTLPALNL